MAIVADFDEPGVRLIVVADGCAAKSGVDEDSNVLDGVTITWRVAECAIPPLVAVTVSG
jgi:hypothetical protein